MEDINVIITGMTAERAKHLADLQYLVMNSAAWGIKKGRIKNAGTEKSKRHNNKALSEKRHSKNL